MRVKILFHTDLHFPDFDLTGGPNSNGTTVVMGQQRRPATAALRMDNARVDMEADEIATGIPCNVQIDTGDVIEGITAAANCLTAVGAYNAKIDLNKTQNGAVIPSITGVGNHEESAFDGVGGASDPDMADYYTKIDGSASYSVRSDQHPSAAVPESYTTIVGGVRFVILHTPLGSITASHIAWFQDRMDEKEYPTIVVTHAHIDVQGEINESFGISDPDRTTLREAIDSNGRVQICFYGHYHQDNNNFIRKGIHYIGGFGSVFIDGEDEFPLATDFPQSLTQYDKGAHYIITAEIDAVFTEFGMRANIDVKGHGYAEIHTRSKVKYGLF